ncbi:unnamed protein product [Camellia sinensis]
MALLGVALVEPRRGGTWEGSSCWAVTLQDIGVYHRDAVYQTKSPRHAHMRFSGTCSRHRPPPSLNRLLSSPPTRTNHHPLSPFPFSALLSESSTMQGTNIRGATKSKFDPPKDPGTSWANSAYQQVGAAYNALRPRVPILPTPMMPMAGNTQLPVNSPLIPGARPPVLPRPLPGWHVRVLPCSWCGFTLQCSGRKEEILKCGKGSNDLERIERGANEVICLHQ